jgi:hypothetical protein
LENWFEGFKNDYGCIEQFSIKKMRLITVIDKLPFQPEYREKLTSRDLTILEKPIEYRIFDLIKRYRFACRSITKEVFSVNTPAGSKNIFGFFFKGLFNRFKRISDTIIKVTYC